MLQIHNLSCGYHSHTILHDIHLSVVSGEIVSIIGPNGSGKTTLLRAISTILTPDNGDIYLNGDHISTISRQQFARNVAVVAQTVEPSFITVEDYILMGRLPYFKRFQFFETVEDRRLAQKYMALTDTLKLKHARMNEISGGERQLASIARALVQEPVLLLLDEPLSHLDIRHQVQILDLIIQLNEALGLTVMMVLHDLSLAAEYSDTLVLLSGENGSVYASGVPADVLTETAIQDVYGARVIIDQNPITKKPCVFLSTKNRKRDTNDRNI